MDPSHRVGDLFSTWFEKPSRRPILDLMNVWSARHGPKQKQRPCWQRDNGKKQSVLLKKFSSEPIQQWLSAPLNLASREYGQHRAATELTRHTYCNPAATVRSVVWSGMSQIGRQQQVTVKRRLHLTGSNPEHKAPTRTEPDQGGWSRRLHSFYKQLQVRFQLADESNMPLRA